jgi:hypothetical protein
LACLLHYNTRRPRPPFSHLYRQTDICQVLAHRSARWHRTATTTTRGSIHSARPLPISSHPGAKQRTLLLSERWHRTAICSVSSHPGCLKTEHFSFSDRALASYCYPPHYSYPLHPGCQAELTDHHTVLTSHASLTAKRWYRTATTRLQADLFTRHICYQPRDLFRESVRADLILPRAL